MPYNNIKDLPPSTKHLTTRQKRKFMEVFNAMVSEGTKEDIAFPVAMKQAKTRKKKISKSIQDKKVFKKRQNNLMDFSFENVVNVLQKYFGSTEAPDKTQVIKSSEQEEMVAYEVIYEPNVKDAHGEWMSEDTILKACDNFNDNLIKGNVKPNLFHLANTDLFTIEKTWIQEEIDVKVEQTGEIIKAGTWVGKIKYHDEDLWNLKKAGIIQGVSIGARGAIDKETGEITDVSFDPYEEE